MKNKETVKVPIVIIGGGLSGLFAGSALLNHSIQFALLESSEKAIGGLAALGGMKIGLLPAGSTTAKYLGHLNYERFTNQFIEEYSLFFTDNEKGKKVESNEYFYNKQYKSFIIEHEKVKTIVDNLKKKIQDNIIFSCIGTIRELNGGEYGIQLKNGLTIICRSIIVASGRNPKTTQLFKELGQKYKSKSDIIVGCRATFNSTMASKELFNHQTDFKVKAKNSFQNYCYNYRGFLHPLRYCGKKYYSGSLNFKSKYGNTFIGKKIRANNVDVLKFLDYSEAVSFNKLERLDFESFGGKYKNEFIEFVDQFSQNYKIEFNKFFFPALEQFWPAPELEMNSLESSNMSNIYFLGDSSGISFGVLQCFILAQFLIEQMVNSNEIS